MSIAFMSLAIMSLAIRRFQLTCPVWLVPNEVKDLNETNYALFYNFLI
jgi:hypothetical protein